MEITNYGFGGANLFLSDDAQIVPGVSGDAAYLPIGIGTTKASGEYHSLTFSIWRQWDGMIEQDAPRGVFSVKTLNVYFDHKTSLMTLVLNGAVHVTDITDNQAWQHWCFTVEKDGLLCIYKNAEKVYEMEAGPNPLDLADGFILGGGKTHATFDEVGVYTGILDIVYITGLFTLISKGVSMGEVGTLVEQSVPLHTPHYLGTVKTRPEGARVKIQVGRKNGFNTANISDWILIVSAIPPYKQGWCYRWNGRIWEILDPPNNYVAEYTACLKDQLELKDMFNDVGFFATILCQYIGFNDAVGKSLTANNAFLDNLITKRLLVDSDTNDPTDFELAINRDVGILAKNNGEKVFEVSPTGDIDAVCFTVTSAMLADKDTAISPNRNIKQEDLKHGQKMFYDGREVEKVGHVSTSSTIQSGIKYCIITGHGERGKIYFEAYSCSYCAWKTVYTIYFKDGTTREDIAQGTAYGSSVRIDKGHVYDEDELPAPLSRPYPTSSTGGPAPGNIIIKGVQKQRRIISFKNLPTTDDDLSSLPIGALFTDAHSYILNGSTYYRPHVGVYMKTEY